MFRVLNCLTTEHDFRLVLVAAVVCFLASFTAISLFQRARVTGGRTRLTWLAGAGIATGGGIWATHFIAMLAYDPGVNVAYNLGLTIASLVIAALITGVGLAVALFTSPKWGPPAGGAIVGAGVACMHYLGMWAVEVPGRVTWHLDLVVGSIVLGMGLGMVAMAVAVRGDGLWRQGSAAVLLALAIVSHHFTAMGAVVFLPDPSRVINASSLSEPALALAVASAAIAILSMSLVSATAGRRLDEKGMLLSIAVNNMAQGLVMFDANDRLVVCNESYLRMYDLPREIIKPGCMLDDVIRARSKSNTLGRESDAYRAEIAAKMAAGESMSWIVEAEGRSISVINRPIPGTGFWVGTHEDVTQRLVSERERASMADQEQRRALIEGAILSFRQTVDTVLTGVSESAAALRSTSTALSASSGATSDRAAGALRTSNEASINVEAAAAAAEQLLASIAEISRQLGQAAELVQTAVAEAHTTNDEIVGLARSAQQIGDVVKLIRHIAGQTNLLALNATIEAARAGESGRGFAVVAAEVKSLAVQTANATEQIAAQVAAIQASTNGAVEAIHRNTERLHEINSYTSGIAASVRQQNAATSEISGNVANAAAGAGVIVAVLDEVAGAVARTRNSADTVLTASEAVEAAAAELRTNVANFLKQVAV